MINALGNGFYFFAERKFITIGKLKAFGTMTCIITLLAQTHHFIGQVKTARTTTSPHLGKRHTHPKLLALTLDQGHLGGSISRKFVNGNHAGKLVHLGDVFYMLQKVGKASLKSLKIFFVKLVLGHAPVVFQSAYRCHYHHGIGLKSGKTALNVQELFCSQIGPETGLSHAVIA